MKITEMNLDNRIIDQEFSNRSTTKVQVCDGFGCTNESEKKIAVSAGTFGIIFLNLCSKCSIAFEPKELSNSAIRMDIPSKTCSPVTRP